MFITEVIQGYQYTEISMVCCHPTNQKRSFTMLGSILWGVIVLLVLFWVLGLVFHIAGGLIHILLVIAIIVLLYNLFVGSRARRTL